MSEFKFIHPFAGIGGIRLGMATARALVLTSEIDRFATKTYEAFFQCDENHSLVHDVNVVEPREMPDHDISCGGFPCQIIFAVLEERI